jgi:ketosteroid isomerase-like protein
VPIARQAAAAATLWLLAAAGPPLVAQALPAPAPTDEAAIRAELAESAAGWNEGNLAKHVGFYTDSVTFMTANGPRPGKAGIIEGFTRSYFRDGRPLQVLSFDRVAVRALGPDHALVTGNFHLRGGDQPEQSGWFTLVWARTPEGWRAVHDHSS